MARLLRLLLALVLFGAGLLLGVWWRDVEVEDAVYWREWYAGEVATLRAEVVRLEDRLR